MKPCWHRKHRARRLWLLRRYCKRGWLCPHGRIHDAYLAICSECLLAGIEPFNPFPEDALS